MKISWLLFKAPSGKDTDKSVQHSTLLRKVKPLGCIQSEAQNVINLKGTMAFTSVNLNVWIMFQWL